MEQNTSDQYFPCAYYAVAYFDVLGQRKRLLELPQYPEGKSERDAMPVLLNKAAKPVFDLRKDLTKFYNDLASISLVSEPPKNLSPAELQAALDYESSELKFQPISDSFVAWVSLPTRKEKLSLFGLHRLLISAVQTMLKQLANGIVIRGAIEIGYGLEYNGHELYGPALARAYLLESRCTNWPRVIVGEGVIKLWNMILHLNEAGMIDQPNVRFTKFDQSLTFVDVDRRIAVDYLGPVVMSRMSDLIEGYKEEARIQVERLRHIYRTDAKIRAKYDRVLQYFNSRMTENSVH